MVFSSLQPLYQQSHERAKSKATCINRTGGFASLPETYVNWPAQLPISKVI
jgi:hypothetical protein